MLISKAGPAKLFLASASLMSLAACGADDENRARAPENEQAMEEAEKSATMQAAEDGRIDCAVNGAEEYRRSCEIERIADDDGQMLVVRHPDGGFRRFRVLTDGRGLEPAEGFDETEVKIIDGDMIEVTSGGDSYRLPAQIKSAPKQETATEAAEDGAAE